MSCVRRKGSSSHRIRSTFSRRWMTTRRLKTGHSRPAAASPVSSNSAAAGSSWSHGIESLDPAIITDRTPSRDLHPPGRSPPSPVIFSNAARVNGITFGNSVVTPGETRMGVLADWQIQELIKIEPFADGTYRTGVISYGVTSYGYDLRLGRKFKVFTNARCAIVDPKHFDPKSFIDMEADECLIPPNSFALAETVEHLEIPRDVIAICVGKSTYARIGIIVNVTPLEPEWRGKVTIEISNTTPLPAKVYAGEGIAQVLFLRAEAPCRTSYADKKGKYQDQSGLTLPFVVKPS